ncbi:diguanylate cyclase [Maridesulfovibrio sp.]|uniref:diguanylate cyclase n=1 Tax=Maridesulfovibrio sp. TaxID=2795000 RepID=UPI002AA92EB2|nr:diguanylate cyclase [Maridesulfovibrio sp.]
MMDQLDMRTMLLVGAMVCLTLAMVMTYYSFARKTYRGFQYWTAGIVSIGLGAVLVSMRRVLPAFVSIVIGNFLIILMPYLLTQGLAVFLNIKWKLSKLNAAALGLFFLGFAWWTYIKPDLHARIIGLSLVMAFFFGQALYLTTKKMPSILKTQEWSLTVALVISTISSLFRFAVTILSTQKIGFLNNSGALQSTALMMIIISVVASACSILILNSHRMEKDLKDAKTKIEKLANIDELSNLFNRRYFNQKLEQEFKRHQRSASSLSLIMLDIDCFKLYNDTYGHQSGDQCIQEVSAILKDSGSRPSDIAARYGGEEFVLLLPDTDTTGAQKVAKTIQKKLKAKSIPHKASTVADVVTLTFGIATIIPDRTTSPESIIKLADQYLYKGKENGKDQIKLYCS